MKRSISQRIYLWGLLPLALLAIMLIIVNGGQRLADANDDLKNAQTLTARLLHSPAVDALVVGNSLSFDVLIKDVISSTPALLCISLRDLSGKVIAEAGKCDTAGAADDFVDVVSADGSLSDFSPQDNRAARVGFLRLSMNTQGLITKRRQLFWQLVLSLVMVVGIVIVVAKVLRSRLIQPIQRLDLAMLEVGKRNYSLRLASDGDDEIARLALEFNRTMETLAVYVRDLERRRADADRALHDADEAALAKDGLVRSLSEDLERPLSAMYKELIELAINNKDPALKEHIKNTMGLLEEMQSNFDDLMEVSTSEKPGQRTAMQDLSDVIAELHRNARMLATAEGRPLAWEDQTDRHGYTGLYVDLDGSRLRKAVCHVLKAMYQHCTDTGVYAQLDAIPLPDNKLHFSMQLRAFYGPPPSAAAGTRVAVGATNKSVPAALRWTERDKTIVEYLLRAANLAVTYSVLPSGMVYIHLEAVVRSGVGDAMESSSLEWLRAASSLTTIIVSDDDSLLKHTQRGYLSRHEMNLLPYTAAIANAQELVEVDALLLDCSHDIGDVFRLVETLKDLCPDAGRFPKLIAICPPGAISEGLETRLMQLGFSAVQPKPIQLHKILETIQNVVTTSLGQHRE